MTNSALVIRTGMRFACFVSLLLLGIPVYAQYSSNVQGVISDPSGAAVNGATVTLRNTDTGVAAVAKSNERGEYHLVGLPPGNYVVSASAEGFR